MADPTLGRSMLRGGTDISRRRRSWVPLLVMGGTLIVAPSAEGQSLRGSEASMERQNRQAFSHDFTFLKNSTHVTRFVELGLLVPLTGNANYELTRVSFPYARPEVRTFVQRLSRQYRRGCGEKLVVTSLTRPMSRQPRNSSDLSVHPTGMAVDLRRSNSRACRAWLEDVLLSLEKGGVLDATRERRPPHYHIALFPGPYRGYVARREAQERQGRAEAPARVAAEDSTLRYQVRRGDSLWTIAEAHGTTVARLRTTNQLRGSKIYAGQVLDIPVSR